MKKLYFKIAIAAILAVWVNIAKAQECLSGGCTVSTSQYPAGTQNASGVFTQIANDMWAGEYSLCNVTSGVTYQWSLCSADGGAASYDSELTLFNGTTNALICYSDDDCGDDGKIGWTATFSGTVKIQVNAFNCLTNSINTTLVWKSISTGSDAGVTEVHTMGTIATTHSNPHVVSAVVRNFGSTTLTNVPVTLSVSGANTFTNTVT